MQAVDKDLMAMKVTELKEELKEELAARDEALSGNKAWLRWRLHTAIVRTHVEARADGRGQLPTRANRAIGYSSGDRPLPVPGSERCSTDVSGPNVHLQTRIREQNRATDIFSPL